jgi:hypothetical protein
MLWAFAATSLALVMVTLDNLVVTTALPVIREDLHASLEGLEWTVNAYTLTFAVLLLTGAALAPSMGVLVAAISSARGSSHACTSRRGLRLRPAAGQRRVWKEAAERPPYPAEESVDCGRERRQPETFQKPTQPASRGEVLEHADRCWAVHHPHPARLDELPRLADLLLGNTRGIASGRLVVPAQERESLPAIQPGDGPRRGTTERSTSVEEQERSTRRRNVPEPCRIEHEARHAPHRIGRGLGAANHLLPVVGSSAAVWILLSSSVAVAGSRRARPALRTGRARPFSSSKRRGRETRACDHDVVRSRWVDVIRCSSSGFAACCSRPSPACRSAPDAPRRCRRSRLLLAAAPDESSTRSCRAGQRPFRRGRRRR